MQLFVACDICGHRYVLPGDREGRNNKCQSCGTKFEVSSDNEFDPETSEFDEVDDDETESSGNPLGVAVRTLGHLLSGVLILAVLIWMSTLLFRSPKDALPASSQQSGSSIAQSTTVQSPIPQRTVPQVMPTQPQLLPIPGSASSYHVGQVVFVNRDGFKRPAVIRRIEPNGDLLIRFAGSRREEIISPSGVVNR